MAALALIQGQLPGPATAKQDGQDSIVTSPTCPVKTLLPGKASEFYCVL